MDLSKERIRDLKTLRNMAHSMTSDLQGDLQGRDNWLLIERSLSMELIISRVLAEVDMD